jgi:hypothetical protein
MSTQMSLPSIPLPRSFSNDDNKTPRDFPSRINKNTQIVERGGPLQRIKYRLSFEGNEVTMTHSIELIRELAHQYPGSYLDVILEAEHVDEEIVYDLTKFDVSSFMYLMRCVRPHKNGQIAPPLLTDDIDIAATKILAGYLYFNQKIIDHLSIEVKDIFFKNLNDIDKIMVDDDRKLRRYLFDHENDDLRHIDITYTLKNMMDVYSQLVPDSDVFQYFFPYGNIKMYFNKETRYSSIPYSSRVTHSGPYGDITHKLGKKVLSKSIVDNYQQFVTSIKTKFSTKTKHILDEFMSPNHPFFGKLVFAGGLINALLTNLKEEYYKHSDVDIFFTIKDPNEAMEIITTIVHKINANSQFKLMFRTQYSLTVIYAPTGRDDDQIVFQFILRLYNSITQIIAPFDIDACACAFTGEEIYVMPRYLRAVNSGYILVDPERQSQNYVYRLYKYLQRGFDLALPGYFVDRDVHNQGKKVTGLAKIINFKETLPSDLYGADGDVSDYGSFGVYMLKSMSRRWYNRQYGKDNGITFYDKLKNEGVTSEYDRKKIIGDYMIDNNIRVPFIATKDMHKLLTGEYKTDMSSLLAQEAALLRKAKDERTTSNFGFVELPFKSSLGPLTFITKNPGSQLTNSFNPTTEDWYRDVYVYREGRHPKLKMYSKYDRWNMEFE